jgi:hypothetical protein
MSKALTASMMAKGEEPKVGQYAMHNNTLLLLSKISASGRFSVDYVGNHGQGGGSSAWWDAVEFSPVESQVGLLLCNIHHANRMVAKLTAERRGYKDAIYILDAALSVARETHQLGDHTDPRGQDGEG